MIEATDGISSDIPSLIRDLEIDHPSGSALAFRQAILERIKIRSRYAITATGQITIRDAFIEGSALPGYAIYVGNASLVIERAILAGNTRGIVAWHGSHVNISNVLVYGTADVALDLQRATGSVAFSTIVDSGSSSSSGASGILCPDTVGLSIQSSIVWTPGAPPPTSGMCMFSTTIAGPSPVAGAMNIDPRFVDAAARDYHLSTTSPARDMVDMGPATDFERDPRPRGLRFDIGADEAE